MSRGKGSTPWFNMQSKVVGIKSDVRHPREHGNPITSLTVSFVLFHSWSRFLTNSRIVLVHVFAVRRLYATRPHGTVRVSHGGFPAVLRIPGDRLKSRLRGGWLELD